MQIPQTFKDHPYAWGFGGFLLLVLLFYWLFKPSAQAASGDPNAAYYGAAALAAQSGNELAAQQLAANAAVNTAQIQSGVQTQAIGAAQSVALAQIGSQATTAQDYINSLLTLGQDTNRTQYNTSQSLFAAMTGTTDWGAWLQAHQTLSGEAAKINNALFANLYLGADPLTYANTGQFVPGTSPPVGGVFSPPNISGPISSLPNDFVGSLPPTPTPAANSNTPIAGLTTVGAGGMAA